MQCKRVTNLELSHVHHTKAPCGRHTVPLIKEVWNVLGLRDHRCHILRDYLKMPSHFPELVLKNIASLSHKAYPGTKRQNSRYTKLNRNEYTSSPAAL